MSLYDREDLRWLATSFSYHFTLMVDLSFYDPRSGRFKIEEFLAEGEHELGGYDAVLLWQAYPRIGFDERNPFDFCRDVPDGLEGLRKLVDECHQRGLKVHIDYNPWDLATRRESVSVAKALADLVAAIDCDGSIDRDNRGGARLAAGVPRGCRLSPLRGFGHRSLRRGVFGIGERPARAGRVGPVRSGPPVRGRGCLPGLRRPASASR